MKKNLLNTPSLKEQRKNIIWNIVAYSSIILSCISIISIQVMQLYALWNIKKNYNKEEGVVEEFGQLAKQKAKLIKDIAQLHNTLENATAHHRANKRFACALDTIIQNLPPSDLQRLEYNQEDIKITVQSPSLELLQTYIDQIKHQNWCGSIYIYSLAKKKNASVYIVILIVKLSQRYYQ